MSFRTRSCATGKTWTWEPIAAVLFSVACTPTAPSMQAGSAPVASAGAQAVPEAGASTLSLLTAPDPVHLNASRARLVAVPALAGLVIERPALRESDVAFFDVHGPRRELRKLFETKTRNARLVGAWGQRLVVVEHAELTATSVSEPRFGPARFSLIDPDGKVETIDTATKDMTVPGEYLDLEPADWVRGARVLLVGATPGLTADVAVFDLEKRALRRIGRAQGCIDTTRSVPSPRVRVRWANQANPLPEDEGCTNRVDVTNEAISFSPGPILPGH